MLSWLCEIGTEWTFISGLERVLEHLICAFTSCIPWKDNLPSLCTGPQAPLSPGPPKSGRQLAGLLWCPSTWEAFVSGEHLAAARDEPQLCLSAVYSVLGQRRGCEDLRE